MIGFAVLLSGLIAATVAVILTVQNPFVGPDFALRETIVVLVGVVVGGIDRLWTATLGGFAIGFATGVHQRRARPTRASTPRLAVFALVILVLLLRPGGLFASARGRRTAVADVSGPLDTAAQASSSRRSWSRSASAPRWSAARTRSTSSTPRLGRDRRLALLVHRQLRVLSFGQISFVAVGAFAAGVMTIPLDSKSGVLPQLFPILRDHTIKHRVEAAARGCRRRASSPCSLGCR